MLGKAIDGFMAAAAKGDKAASSPEKAGLTIEHTLTAPRPRTRCLVGRDAREQALVKALLPDRFRDLLVGFLMRG